MKGIAGSFDVSAETGAVRLEINKLAEGTSSTATATKGNIVASVDPEVGIWANAIVFSCLCVID